ncbi:MAG: flagellar filament capping protein FliD, partial [Lachnospiraceae bacterium]|nr:flagellar filament capping protein FliD [Lachnospiraceae bacterium]
VLTNVKMFVETYNNLAESTGSSDSDSINKLKRQITMLTKDNRDELESLGITINSSGKLSLDKSKFGQCSPSKIERFFGKDSEFMSSIRSYSQQTKRAARRLVEDQSEELNQSKNITNSADASEAELLESLLANPETTGSFDARG